MGSSASKKKKIVHVGNGRPLNGMIKQWVARVTNYSSQYDDSQWCANNLVGVPKVYPGYGDLPGTWAQGIRDDKQFVELEFEEYVYVAEIDIFETYNSGGVVAIKGLDDSGTWRILWKTNKPKKLSSERVFSPVLVKHEWGTNKICLEVDCTAAESWVEIDAVQIYGHRAKRSHDDMPSSPASCEVPNTFTNPKRQPVGTISQWVEKVTKYSSQYDNRDWPATCVIGLPKVYPRHGDIPGAWAPEVKDDKQFLELEYKEPVFVTGIDIYETYNLGGVTAVKVLDKNGDWQALWATQKPEKVTSSIGRIFSPPLKRPSGKTKQVRIEVDCTACHSWVEIDAVQLHGLSKVPDDVEVLPEGTVSQWVESVTKFSSEYDDKSWPASCVIGAPKVYPKYGDIPGAWAPHAKCIDGKQFLELQYKEAVYITRIDIYETYNAGGVVAVKGLDDKGAWQILWKAEKPTNIKSSRLFSPKLSLSVLQCPTRNIRLDIDCMAAMTWVEIDAVQLHGRKNLADSAEANLQKELSTLSKDSSVSDELVLNDKEMSDCRFLVGKEVVFAHKDIICGRSEYFKKLFSDKSKVAGQGQDEKTQREIRDVSYTGFMGVLHHIYHFKLPDTYSCVMLTEVWRAADMYDMTALVSEVEMEIKAKVDENNVIEVFEAAQPTPTIEPVSNFCKKYMTENIEKIVNAPNFTSFPYDVMAYPY